MSNRKSVGNIQDIPVVFTKRIPISEFQAMDSAPTDGTIIFVMDDFGHIDLAKYDEQGWTAEAGVCSEFTCWAKFHLSAEVAK